MRIAALVVSSMILASLPARGETIRVSVAVSLKEAVTEIGKDYEARTGDRVEFSFGSSGQIMAQIKGGAAVDAFISAADKQVDELIEGKFADAETRRVVAGNTLVLVVPKDSSASIDSFKSLGGPRVKRVALGEPKTVPAGQYATQVLEKLKLAEPLAKKLVFGSNVRQVLDYVVRNEVSAGLVYATDAKKAGDRVKVVATAPADSHDKIVYPAVIVTKSGHAEAAKKFLDHLGTEEAARALMVYGFTVAEKLDGKEAGQSPAGQNLATRNSDGRSFGKSTGESAVKFAGKSAGKSAGKFAGTPPRPTAAGGRR